MLPVFISDISLPLRRFARSRLFATTALISLAALPGAARADMELDLSRVDQGWSDSSQIWLDADGDHDNLPANETGVITGSPSGRITMRVSGPVTAAGLRLDGGDFRLRRDGFWGGELNANGSDPLEFWVGSGHELVLDIDVDGDVHIDGPGTLALGWQGALAGNVVNDGFFALRGEVTGDVRNNDRLNILGTVNGRVDDYGQTYVVSDSSADEWQNHDGGELIVQEGSRLSVANALQNSGDIALQGEISADLVNDADGSLSMEGGTLDGDLDNAGGLTGRGTVSGEVRNTGTVTTDGALTVGTLVNDEQVTVRGGDSLTSTGGALQNNDRLTVNGSLSGGLDNSATGTVNMGANGAISGGVDNAGTMNIAGQVAGRLTNDNILATSGDVRVGQLTNNVTGTMTVGAGHVLTADQRVVNRGQATVAGTIAGDLLNGAGATTALNGGSVTGTLENDGVLNARGSVGTLDNNQTLNLTGDLQVERLDNSGTATVDAGETVTATQRIDNSSALNIAGTVTVNGTAGIQNSASGTVTLDGAEVNGNLTNRGTLLVNSSSQVNGDLTNRNQLTLDGTNGSVTLGVDGIFTNSGRVDGTNGTEDTLTIVADLFANEGGTVNNVDIIGDLLNRSTVTYSEDSFLEGNLTNDTSGDITVSAGLDMRGHDLDNRGDLHVTTDADSSGALNNVRALTNEGTLAIDAGTTATAQSVRNHDDGVMEVAGTLTTATALENEAELNLSGQLTGDLDNSGTTTLAAGTVAGSVTNSGNLQGAGTITGGVTNSGSMEMTGTVTGTVTNTGTLTQDGSLSVAGVVNDEVVDITSTGVLTATGVVENRDRLTVAGRLNGMVQNQANGRLTLNGGTVDGRVVNLGQTSGSGTITGALSNAGSATLSGRVGGGVENAATGVLTSQGRLSVASVQNAGLVDVAAGSTLQSDTAVQNGNELIVSGRLEADVVNHASATLDGGTIAGTVTNAGTLTGNGTIAALANNGTATLAGRVTGAVTNAGTLTSSGTLRVGSLVNDEVLNVAAGSTLRGDGTLVNNDRATLAGRIEGTLSNRGSAVLAGGTLAGRLENGGTLTGTGTVTGTLANAGNATIAGRVDRLENTGTLALQDDLSVATLINDERVTVGAGHRLSLDDGMVNNDRLSLAGTLDGFVENHGTVTLDGGTVEGDVASAGTLNGRGRITGRLVNDGTLTTGARLNIGQLFNNQTMSIAETGVLTSAATVQNAGGLTLAGQLQADLANRAGATATLTGGTIAGDVGNLGRLTGTGTIAGMLENAGTATLGGSVQSLRNLRNGRLDVAGTLSTEEFLNAGTASIAAGSRLAMADPDAAQGAPVAAQNLASGALTVDGTLQGALVNAGTLAGAGTITGAVLNTGSADWAGRIQGTVTNRADLTLAGTLAGGLVNEAGNFTTRGGDATVAGGMRNESGATARIVAGSGLTATGGILNQAGGNFFLNGRLTGDLENRGTLTQAGTLDGSLATSGRATLAGTVTGDLIYDGGTLVLRDGASIGRDLRLNADYTLGAGSQVSAARTVVGSGTTLALAGLLDGALLNQGTVEVAGNQAHVSGAVTNSGTLDMADNSTSGVLRIGGLNGSGTYRLDLNLRTMTADRIEVLGGAAHGNYHLDFDLTDRDTVPQRGARVTLIDVDESFGSANDFNYTRSDLPAGSERIVYSVQRAGSDRQGDLELVSQLNPAMGAIFGNVALVQSLIGSVVNRPTSPFVTALAYEDQEKPCGIGSWGRAIGGHATASGRTDNGISNVETEVNADYYGLQVGTDLACFDNRFGGWNMAFGALAGINRGSTSQPVYAIDPSNSQDLTSILTSYTSTDFEQRYAGLYATATKGRFQADLQYRIERTDFTIENKPLPGYTGLGLDETDFSSDTQTLSGSISYGFPIGDSGWAVLPTMGFAWSKLSTDSIRFDEDYTLIFKDSTRKIGFAGATLAKTFVDNGRNTALYAFATGTWYKDFADPTISLFASAENTETLTTENLGSYGELSVGANWIKVMGPKARGRQLSAGARIDARFGDQLDSVGVSGQFRWQF